MSRISYIQLRLQTSSRRCLSGSSSCIIRSFSALILSSRRCCAAYNFKTKLLFNLRFFFSPTKKKTRMLKDKIWLLTSCLWECDCFKRFSSSSRRFFSALAFAYKWKGKVFLLSHHCTKTNEFNWSFLSSHTNYDEQGKQKANPHRAIFLLC